MSRPTVFISSSTEGLEVADELKRYLAGEAQTLIWRDQVFPLGEFSFDSLFRMLDKIDFAILVLTLDDLVSRQVGSASPRNNVIFELGLFMGRLGRSRTIVIMEDGASNQLPSNLAGSFVRFRRSGLGNLLASLSPAFDQIRTAIREERLIRTQSVAEPYSCFISYSVYDRVFAERICNDLQEVGIRCWLDSKDLKIGDHIKVQINHAIQSTDKVLLILSEASVKSSWVQHEINVVLNKEYQANKTILFPIRIDDSVMKSQDGMPAMLVKLKHIGDFTDWTIHDNYRRAFSRLVKDLTVSAAVEQDWKL